MESFSKNLIIISDFDFDNPTGAGFSRMVNYSKACKSTNTRVIFLSTNYDYSGNPRLLKKEYYDMFLPYEKIIYKSTFDDFHFIRIRSFFHKAFDKLYHELGSQENITVLLYNSTIPTVWYSLFFLKRKHSSRIFIEKNELKTAIALNKQILTISFMNTLILMLFKPIWIFAGLITDLLAFWFDGIIVISTRLERFYSKLHKNVIRIPIIASDIKNTLPKRIQNREREFQVGYFGWIGEKKDGLFSLIKSVVYLNENIDSKIIVNIYGDGSKINLLKLKEICKQFHRIKYHGRINHKEVSQKLLENDLLAFPRPKNLQTMFGFSTKLAEFMLSGVPVLTTDVSDNGLYIKDRQNGFLIESKKKNDSKILAEKLYEIVNMDEGDLRKIGMSGQSIALKHFSPYIYGNILDSYLYK